MILFNYKIEKIMIVNGSIFFLEEKERQSKRKKLES
jgi:hypothetical protein